MRIKVTISTGLGRDETEETIFFLEDVYDRDTMATLSEIKTQCDSHLFNEYSPRINFEIAADYKYSTGIKAPVTDEETRGDYNKL